MRKQDYPATAWIEYATPEELFDFLTKSSRIDDLSADEIRGILIAVLKRLAKP